MRTKTLPSRVATCTTGAAVALAAAAALAVPRTLAAQSGPEPAYAAAQAARGEALYAGECASCHGASLEGGAAPALSGRIFRKSWSVANATLDDLHYVSSTTMPPGAPESLSDEEHLDVLAYILRENGIPAGREPLRDDPELLRAVRMAEVDADAPPTAPPFIDGVRSRPTGAGPSARDLVRAPSDPAGWPYHTRDFRGTRHTPLAGIDPSNAATLEPVCRYEVGDPANFQTGPVVHHGVMYVTGVHTTAAIDAATCREIWRHEWEVRDPESFLNSRGVAIQDGYVVRGTADGYLFALDAADGKLLWARQVADPWIGETFTMPPLIYEDRVFIGPAVSELAISGWLGAFSLEDGEPLWRFETVPGATREGGETWGNPTGIPLGGGAIWTPLSFDPEREELYVSVSNPAPDLPAYLRPGPNLYTNSVVALDATTGELRCTASSCPTTTTTGTSPR